MDCIHEGVNLRPILKWVGGKRRLLPVILPHIPENPSLYVEPFLGGGAVLLANRPHAARINDANPELINVYLVVRSNPTALIEALRLHENNNSPEYYYKVRAMDRNTNFKSLDKIQRAARFIYLNKTCFNGICRVNSRGQYNVSYGRYSHPNIVDEEAVYSLSGYLRGGHSDYLWRLC